VLKPALSSKRRSVHILRTRESRHAGSWHQNLLSKVQIDAAALFRHKLEPGVAKNEVVH
jgi:RNA:NAD 2'-phosphotransferase (TPT1/KptA family)